MRLYLRRAAVISGAAALLLSGTVAAPASAGQKEEPTSVQLLSITDFHGQLTPGNGKRGEVVTADGEVFPAGGAAYLASHLENIRDDENSVFFSTGDNFSGWPSTVRVHNDEPTIEFMNHVGLGFTTLGNHELDVSEEFLVDHMAKGKCYGTIGVDSCFTNSQDEQFSGSDFDYYSGNLVTADKGKSVLPATNVVRVKGEKGRRPVGFINLMLPSTQEGRKLNNSYQPHLVTRAIVESANEHASKLRQKGVKAIVLNLHEGALTSGGFNECKDVSEWLVDLNKQLSADIDAILGGHRHKAINCSLDDPQGNPRPVVTAASQGRVINEINLQLDPNTGEVLREATTSENHAVTRDVQPDAEVQAMVDYWVDKEAETRSIPIGEVSEAISSERDASGESAIHNLQADAYMEDANNGAMKRYNAKYKHRKEPYADFAVSAEKPAAGLALDRDGVISFDEAWKSVGSHIGIMSTAVTGEQIDSILEAQWRKNDSGEVKFHPLAVSDEVQYTYDDSRPVGDRVDTDSIMISSKPIDENAQYRVATRVRTVFGDRTGFAEAFDGSTDPVRHSRSRDAFRWYLQTNSPVKAPALDRVSVSEGASASSS